MNNLASGSFKLGERIIFALKLQAYWFVVVFRYGIVGGIFPATAAALDCLFEVLNDQEEIAYLSLKKVLKKGSLYVRQGNAVGFLASLGFLALGLDIKINSKFLQNTWIHVCLVALLILLLSVCLYLFPSMIRYELSVKDIFRQAFFLVLCSWSNTVAMLLGIGIATYLSVLLPLLGLLPVPIYLVFIAHFSLQAMKKLEEANKKNLE